MILNAGLDERFRIEDNDTDDENTDSNVRDNNGDDNEDDDDDDDDGDDDGDDVCFSIYESKRCGHDCDPLEVEALRKAFVRYTGQILIR